MTTPGRKRSPETRAKIGASVRAAVAASSRWRAPSGYEAEYVRLRSGCGAAEAKRMIDLQVEQVRKRSAQQQTRANA